jgi:hypothetical protein
MINLGLAPARASTANKASQVSGGIAVKSNSTGITASEEAKTNQVLNDQGIVENNGSVPATSSVTDKEVTTYSFSTSMSGAACIIDLRSSL